VGRAQELDLAMAKDLAMVLDLELDLAMAKD
jgi:hypothetical protein